MMCACVRRGNFRREGQEEGRGGGGGGGGGGTAQGRGGAAWVLRELGAAAGGGHGLRGITGDGTSHPIPRPAPSPIEPAAPPSPSRTPPAPLAHPSTESREKGDGGWGEQPDGRAGVRGWRRPAAAAADLFALPFPPLPLLCPPGTEAAGGGNQARVPGRGRATISPLTQTPPPRPRAVPAGKGETRERRREVWGGDGGIMEPLPSHPPSRWDPKGGRQAFAPRWSRPPPGPHTHALFCSHLNPHPCTCTCIRGFFPPMRVSCAPLTPSSKTRTPLFPLPRTHRSITTCSRRGFPSSGISDGRVGRGRLSDEGERGVIRKRRRGGTSGCARDRDRNKGREDGQGEKEKLPARQGETGRERKEAGERDREGGGGRRRGGGGRRRYPSTTPKRLSALW